MKAVIDFFVNDVSIQLHELLFVHSDTEDPLEFSLEKQKSVGSRSAELINALWQHKHLVGRFFLEELELLGALP